MPLERGDVEQTQGLVPGTHRYHRHCRRLYIASHNGSNDDSATEQSKQTDSGILSVEGRPNPDIYNGQTMIGRPLAMSDGRARCHEPAN